MSKEQDIKNRIASYERRSQKLKEQQSIMGVSTPPEILTEIEDIEIILDELWRELFTESSHPIYYGIIKDSDQLGLNLLSLEIKDKINNKIDSLQLNPRPLGHKPTVERDCFNLEVEVGTRPKYNLCYKINETRKVVSILRLDPIYWQF